MLKTIAKWLCPSSKKLASGAANKIANGFNFINDSRREKLVKYSACVKRIAAYQAKFDLIIADGRIYADEEARIAAALEPLIEEAKNIVFE